MTNKDYNLINWKDLVKEDSTSVTGLVWSMTLYNGRYKNIPFIKAGEQAGYIGTNRTGVQRARLRYKGVAYLIHRILWIIRNGSIDNNLVIDHIDGNTLNNSTDNLRLVSSDINTRNSKMLITNSSGKTGVGFYLVKDITYAECFWCDGKGKQHKKRFNCNILGLLPAFASACAYREQKIKEFNQRGYNYSDRHGLENISN
jgi:HNH endonuclease